MRRHAAQCDDFMPIKRIEWQFLFWTELITPINSVQRNLFE